MTRLDLPKRMNGCTCVMVQSSSVFVLMVPGHDYSHNDNLYPLTSTSMFEISAFFGLHHYLQWEMEHDLTLLDKHAKAALRMSVLGGNPGEWDSNTSHLHTHDLLLKQGCSPQTPLHSYPAFPLSWTVWDSLMIHTFLDPLLQFSIEQMEWFLDNDADTNIEVTLPMPEEAGVKLQLKGVTVGGEEAYHPGIYKLLRKNGGRVTLLDLIESYWPNENDRMRELIVKAQNRASKHVAVIENQDIGLTDRNSASSGQDFKAEIIPSFSEQEAHPELAIAQIKDRDRYEFRKLFRNCGVVGLSLLGMFTFCSYFYRIVKY